MPDLDAAPYTGAVDVAFDPVNPNRVYATLWDHHRSSYLRPYGGIGSGLYVTDNALARHRRRTWRGSGSATRTCAARCRATTTLRRAGSTSRRRSAAWASRSRRATTRAST